MTIAPVLALAEFPEDMPPLVAVVVDTEEKFDWNAPFTRKTRDVSSVAEQIRAHSIFDRLGIVPTYVIDDPVVSDSSAAGLLREFHQDGRCEIGAHLHPWVSPPFNEEVNRYNSYHGNLAPAVEREKLLRLTEAIAKTFGHTPRVFKAGRYGLGPSTFDVLEECGYTVDCSVVPYSSFAEDGGPNFYGFPDRPYWSSNGLFEVPLSRGFFGYLPWVGERMPVAFDARLAVRMRLPGVLGRLGIARRSTLTPEGISIENQKRLVKQLLDRGHKVLTLTYHSSSLGIGCTPYARTEEERDRVVAALSEVLEWLQHTSGCRFTTVAAVRNAAVNSV